MGPDLVSVRGGFRIVAAVFLLSIVTAGTAVAESKPRFKNLVGDWTLESVDGVAPSIQLGITFRTGQPMVSFTDGCRQQQAYKASVQDGELVISEIITKKVKGRSCPTPYPAVSSTIASSPRISISKRKLLIGPGLIYVRAR